MWCLLGWVYFLFEITERSNICIKLGSNCQLESKAGSSFALVDKFSANSKHTLVMNTFKSSRFQIPAEWQRAF